jgi:hypothetical protein
LLVDCGHRNQRVRHVKYCLHCERAITPGTDAKNVQIVQGKTRGWLCGPRCVCAYFAAPSEPPPQTVPPEPAPRDTEASSHSRPGSVFTFTPTLTRVPVLEPAAPLPESTDHRPVSYKLALAHSRTLRVTRLRVSVCALPPCRDDQAPPSQALRPKHPRLPSMDASPASLPYEGIAVVLTSNPRSPPSRSERQARWETPLLTAPRDLTIPPSRQSAEADIVPWLPRLQSPGRPEPHDERTAAPFVAPRSAEERRGRRGKVVRVYP